MFNLFKDSDKTVRTGMICTLVFLSLFLAVKTVQGILAIDTIGDPAPFEHQITIEGSGKASVIPDVAMVDIGLTVKGKNVAEVQKENSQKTNNLMKLFTDEGVDKKDMKTTNYSLSQWMEWDNKNMTNVDKGWIISQNLQLKIRDLDKVSKILELAGQNGSTSISGPNFVVDDMTELKAEARKKAIADAKTKAEKLADDLDMDIGKIISYYEYADNNPMPMYNFSSMMKDGMGAGVSESAPAIAAGTNEITVNVTLGYLLEED